MIGAKIKPVGSPTFAEHGSFEATGYRPVPCPWGASVPTGPWQKFAPQLDGGTAVMGVSVLCGAYALVNVAGDAMRASWCAALSVDTHDKRLARDIDTLVESRLVYRDGVEPRQVELGYVVVGDQGEVVLVCAGTDSIRDAGRQLRVAQAWLQCELDKKKTPGAISRAY